MSVKSFWLSKIEKEKKESYINHLRTVAELEVLREEVSKKLDEIRRSRLKEGSYTAAWPYKQAASNGEEKMLTTILSWLDFS